MDRIIVGYVFIVIFGVFGIFTDCFAVEPTVNPYDAGYDAGVVGAPNIHAVATPQSSTPAGVAGVTAANETLTKVSGASAGDDGTITTLTSEMVPGATCECKDTINQCTKVETRKYQCTTKKGLAGFQEVFAKLIRYVINIVLLLGVLAVTGLGIVWSFAGGDDVKMKSTLKTWAINIVVGLIILFMFRYILMFLAPWIYM